MALQQWSLPALRKLLPLDDGELQQIVTYTSGLPDSEAAQHLENLLGDSPQSLEFIASFIERRAQSHTGVSAPTPHGRDGATASMKSPPSFGGPVGVSGDLKNTVDASRGSASASLAASAGYDVKQQGGDVGPHPPAYAAAPWPSTATSSAGSFAGYYHTNDVIEAGKRRAVDEQEMQQLLLNLQYDYNIYNSDIEPEHEAEYYCSCDIHQYWARKMNRLGVQELWSRAVMYPGEKFYYDNPNNSGIFSGNPYKFRVVSPYGIYRQSRWGPQRPIPTYHAQSIHQTIALNNELNRSAQARVDALEPRHSIWDDNELPASMENLSLGDKKRLGDYKSPVEGQQGEVSDNKRRGLLHHAGGRKEKPSSGFSGLKKAMGIKSSEEKAVDKANALREAIIAEEQGRWPDGQWRQIVAAYQDKVGMTRKIADLRARCPLQYLHLLKAGYFEPIPVAWANQASNPLKFTVDAAAGWRGITPTWRGYEDLAEERLYWVLNHREGSVGMRMKPDFISEMDMARARMARAVEPPPLYYSEDDTCRVQHTSAGYSKQVMPAPFRPYDRPESRGDDTMILLDVSGSMDMLPTRPVYDQYLITRYEVSSQPRNKDVAKAIVRRFADAMANHHHQSEGYDLVTFSSQAKHIGTISHGNFEQKWRTVRFGGGTRVMTGWQKVKELHFQKHSNSAIHHPVYGWQAGPQTPILRLLLLLDGEATDMDEFELDLLGLSWAHVTIFLIGVDGCPHHHRHANELQRISDVNHHVSFVDAQGNCPERFVTHELLKRHLGYDISMQEFEQMEELPAYSVTATA